MRLAVRIFNNEEGGYTAVCPSLPVCCTRGGTREEAREKMDEAIRGYMAAVSNFVPENVIQDPVEA